jgi:hypothetical protein
MSHIFSQKPILFLKGTFKSDCKSLDQLVEERFSENIKDQGYEKPLYDKVPKYFETTEKWPKSLNLNCPICTKSCLTPDGPLYAIPKGFDSNGKIPIFGIIFNTPVCAAKFISIYQKDSEVYKQYLLKFHNIITGEDRKIEFIPTSDLWEISCYGGDRDLNDWLKIQVYNDNIYYKQFQPSETSKLSKSRFSKTKSKSNNDDSEEEDLIRMYEHMGCQEDLHSEDTGYAIY